MEDTMIRKAELRDIPALGRLLYEVHKVHSDVRPDLFKAGTRKYTDGQLEEILQSGERPVFVAEQEGQVVGYAFCIPKQFVGDRSMTDVRTLYIDDLCVDEAARGKHIGTKLYDFVLDFARRQGYYNVTLNVWADNKAAVKFYEKIGLRIQKIGMEKIL